MYYYCMLFVVVASLVYVFQRKLEHLTIQEVDDKTDKTVDRITKLENEYSALHATLTSQEERMKAATSQATEAQAFLHAPIDD
jgi:septal ring factor EnvC (AmiA/AmiB activator)